MNLKLIIFCLILLGSCQESSPVDEVGIFLPNGSSNQEKNIITEIREKSELEHSDFIQLALIYAKYDSDTKVIEYLLDESLKLNKEKACEHLNGVLTLRNEWSLAEKYEKIIRTSLARYKCDITVQNSNQ